MVDTTELEEFVNTQMVEVSDDYYSFILSHLSENGVTLNVESVEVREVMCQTGYVGQELVTYHTCRPLYPYHPAFPFKPQGFVNVKYYNEVFISLFEQKSKSKEIKTYFVCYLDNKTKELGNTTIKLWKGLKDAASLDRLIAKLGDNKVILNYKELS